MRIGLIELFLAYGLKAEGPHHRIEEDLQKVHVVFIVLLHDLDPLDRDLIFDSVVFALVDGQLSDLLKGEDTKTPVYVELKLLLDLVAAQLQHVLAECTRIVRDFRLKFDRVLVDSCYVFAVEVDVEKVAVQLDGLAFGLSGTSGLFGEELGGGT